MSIPNREIGWSNESNLLWGIAKQLNELKGIMASGSCCAPSYKVYTALLTQTGTTAPVATVLENTIGDIVWSYADVGQYFGTLNGAFPLNKTGCFIGGTGIQSNCPSFVASGFPPSHPNAGNAIYVQCSGVEFPPDYYTDGALLNTIIEIRVYN